MNRYVLPKGVCVLQQLLLAVSWLEDMGAPSKQATQTDKYAFIVFQGDS